MNGAEIVVATPYPTTHWPVGWSQIGDLALPVGFLVPMMNISSRSRNGMIAVGCIFSDRGKVLAKRPQNTIRTRSSTG